MTCNSAFLQIFLWERFDSIALMEFHQIIVTEEVVVDRVKKTKSAHTCPGRGGGRE